MHVQLRNTIDIFYRINLISHQTFYLFFSNSISYQISKKCPRTFERQTANYFRRFQKHVSVRWNYSLPFSICTPLSPSSILRQMANYVCITLTSYDVPINFIVDCDIGQRAIFHCSKRRWSHRSKQTGSGSVIDLRGDPFFSSVAGSMPERSRWPKRNTPRIPVCSARERIFAPRSRVLRSSWSRTSRGTTRPPTDAGSTSARGKHAASATISLSSVSLLRSISFFYSFPRYSTVQQSRRICNK